LSILVTGYSRNVTSNIFIKESPELELFIHSSSNTVIKTGSQSDDNSIIARGKGQGNKSNATGSLNDSKSRKILNLTALEPPNGVWKRYQVELTPEGTVAADITVEVKLLRPLDTGHLFIRSDQSTFTAQVAAPPPPPY
jgi:hypothetical protein